MHLQTISGQTRQISVNKKDEDFKEQNWINKYIQIDKICLKNIKTRLLPQK